MCFATSVDHVAKVVWHDSIGEYYYWSLTNIRERNVAVLTLEHQLHLPDGLAFTSHHLSVGQIYQDSGNEMIIL